MVVCEMCGKDSPLLVAEIEGAEMKVCSGCAKYGTIKKSSWQNSKSSGKNLPQKSKPVQEKLEFKLIDNFAQKIKSARDARNLTQEDFAKLINEKESISSKWERGEFKPSIETARRLEKVLGLILVIKEENSTEKIEVDKKTNELTLGDFVKVRKRH